MATKSKKGLILGVALVLPAVLYIFLQMFGENRYALPVYYPQGVLHTLDNPPEKRDADIAFAYRGEGPDPGWEAACDFPEAPHVVGTADLTTFDGRPYDITAMGTPYVVALLPPPLQLQPYAFMLSELNRLRTDYPAERVQIVTVMPTDSSLMAMPPVTSQLAGWHSLMAEPEAMARWANCQLVLPHPLARRLSAQAPHTFMLTLVDARGRIRGYYDGNQQKETDRLDVELRVLLQEKE